FPFATSCLLRARHSCLYPIPGGSHELFDVDRRNRTRTAVIAQAGLPRPFHQFSLMMLYQSCAIQSAVLRAVRYRVAHCGTRADLVSRVLPLHRKWRQMPAFRAWHARAVCIGRLMTSRTLQCGNTFALWAAHYIKEVAMSVIALLWIIAGGVTVDVGCLRNN